MFEKREFARLREKYGPWAVVTGASSGIGRGLAAYLARAGLNVVLVARRRELLEELSAEIQAAGRDVKIISADLAVDAGIAAVQSGTKNLDVGLFVAAAGFGTSGPLLKSELTSELEMLAVNCRALLTLTHTFSRRFVERGRGGVVLLSSMVAFQGVPFAGHYAATKAYVQSLAEALRVELGPLNVDVLAAAPGPTESGFAERANMRMGAALAPEELARPIMHALGRRSTVLPGLLTKFLVGSLATLPRWGKVRAMGVVMNGMTKHQA